MALQSTFYQDITKYEPPVRSGFTKRQVITGIQMIPGLILIFLEVFFLTDALFYITASVTGLIFLGVPIFRYLGKFRAIKNEIEFFIVEQERVYEVGQIRRYEAHEFIQKKEVRETDQF